MPTRLCHLLAITILLLAPLAAQAQWVVARQSSDSQHVQTGPGFLVFGFYYSSDGVFVTHDGGATVTSPGLVSSAGVLPSTMFSDLHDGELTAYLDSNTGDGIFRTRDGITWTRVSSLEPQDPRFTPRWWGNTLLASSLGRILRSDDGGATWADVPPVPADADRRPSVAGAVRTASGARAYVTTYYGGPQTYYSDDLATWTLSADSVGAPTQMEGTQAFAVADPARTTATVENGVFLLRVSPLRYTTDGMTWRGVTLPLWRDRIDVGTIRGVARVDPQTAFVSTVGGYVALTRDAGASWALTDSLGRFNVEEEGLATDGRSLFNNIGGTLLRRPLSDYGLATAADAAPEAGGLALTVAPNPAVGTARLGVTLVEASEVRVSLTDVLGRTVRTLDRVLPAGTSAVALDLAGLAPGLYVARLVSTRGSVAVRVTVAR